jgi:hypothetical protein
MTFPAHNSRDDRFARIKSPLSLAGQDFGLTANFWFFQGINFLTDWLPKSMFTGRFSGSPAYGIALSYFNFRVPLNEVRATPSHTIFSDWQRSSRPGPLSAK